MSSLHGCDQRRDIRPPVVHFRDLEADPVDQAPRIKEALDKKESGVQVESFGVVEKVLSDDTKGDRHQRFILRLSTGQTVMVAHNIDIAPRVPGLRFMDRVYFRGVYEWNNKGGVIHWTHHDPEGIFPGGWLEHQGLRYQ